MPIKRSLPLVNSAATQKVTFTFDQLDKFELTSNRDTSILRLPWLQPRKSEWFTEPVKSFGVCEASQVVVFQEPDRRAQGTWMH